jgi:hypothetical protein
MTSKINPPSSRSHRSLDSRRVGLQRGAHGLIVAVVLLLLATLPAAWAAEPSVPERRATEGAGVNAQQSTDIVGLNTLAAWQGSVDGQNSTTGLAWGDVDNDGDLDLAMVSNGLVQVYLNEHGMLETSPSWLSADSDGTGFPAWGDPDGDGDLDLAVKRTTAAGGQQKIYTNQGGTLTSSPGWVSSDSVGSASWVDVDKDGDLDLTTGFWGDLDGDGDLDVVTQQNVRAYRNNGGQLATSATTLIGGVPPAPLSLYRDSGVGTYMRLNWNPQLQGGAGTNFLATLEWVDLESDGDLDISLIYGDETTAYIQTFVNTNGIPADTPSQSILLNAGDTPDFDWGDVDSDGDLDLAVAYTGWASWYAAQVYLNTAGQLASQPSWVADDLSPASAAAWGDVDGDGDLDLVIGNDGEPSRLYLNEEQLTMQPSWTSDFQAWNGPVAWGDADNDDDLDIAAINGSQVRLDPNNGGSLSTTPGWTASPGGDLNALAWGDVNADGRLDLAVGGDGGAFVYLNGAGGLNTIVGWQVTSRPDVSSLAWGDVDKDSDLDLAIGYANQSNALYLNTGGTLATDSAWQPDVQNDTTSLAWGDVDNDGDLDLAVSNNAAPNRLYLNDGGTLATTATWNSSTMDHTTSLAWGDVNGDGNLDLVTGAYGPEKLYLNQGGSLPTIEDWASAENYRTETLAWGDVDGDGDLDLAAGSGLVSLDDAQPIAVYINEEGMLNREASWRSDPYESYGLAWGDLNGDGQQDLAASRTRAAAVEASVIYSRPAMNSRWRPENHGWVRIGLASNLVPTFNQPVLALAPANFYAIPAIRMDAIPISYTLFDPTGATARGLLASYSPNGGGQWLPAVAAAGTVTMNLATRSQNGEPVEHFFIWDPEASGFFGQSDNVVIRLEVLPGSQPTGPYMPSPFQRPAYTAQSYPFRVRGNQVRVLSGTLPVSGAMVYRLAAGASGAASAMADSGGIPFETDTQGFLQGRGTLTTGDTLFALAPVSETASGAMLYYTNATPTTSGASGETLTALGVQTLTVSSANPLLVFDLSVSLEWDARNDSGYLAQLESDLERASEIMYDLTNGQVALGQITVYQAKEEWETANVVVYASNSQRPNADIGGVSLSTQSDTLSNTEVITDAYEPGQVRMGATWNRFGLSSGNLGEDWPRALAHELGHYLLFQMDNYLGVSDAGLLTGTDCAGSAMTDAYNESELLIRDEWVAASECLKTLAQHTTGRADWETITTFYPDLLAPALADRNSGPNAIPMALTAVEFVDPDGEAEALAAPYFGLVDQDGEDLVPSDNARGYLFKTQGTSDPTDDYVIALGEPNRELLQARGAEPGDRLCVFDPGSDTPSVGCLESVGSSESTFSVGEVPGWEPQITVNAITSATFQISVTLSQAESALSVQVLPLTGTASAETAMLALSSTNYSQTITLNNGTFWGFVRVWVPNSDPLKEAITQFTLSGDWGGNRVCLACGNRVCLACGNQLSWNAPVASSDGQVALFTLDQILGTSGTFALQTLSDPPLPDWLWPIGSAYRLTSDQPLDNSSITFSYLQRNVPDGYEAGLVIYYSSDEGQNWQALTTELDTSDNFAAAEAPGEGLYALIATVELPALEPGWNLIAYPVETSRAVTEALLSISGAYTTVYSYDPTASTADRWLVYDVTAPSYVNTLSQLEYGRGYWINASQAITPLLPIDVSTKGSTDLALPAPPATFYGPVQGWAGFSPVAGQVVQAWVAGQLCGEGRTLAEQGQIVFVVHVSAHSTASHAGCGMLGQTISFQVGSHRMGTTALWDNRQLHPLTLQPSSQARLYLPLVIR